MIEGKGRGRAGLVQLVVGRGGAASLIDLEPLQHILIAAGGGGGASVTINNVNWRFQ